MKIRFVSENAKRGMIVNVAAVSDGPLTYDAVYDVPDDVAKVLIETGEFTKVKETKNDSPNE